MRKTKIIATLGPSSFNFDIISKFVDHGMDVARINMSHHNDDFDLGKYIRYIRQQAEENNRTISILFDLCGPKIRIAKEIGNIEIIKGNTYTLGEKGCDIPLNLDLSFKFHKSNGLIKINDGKIVFQIEKVNEKCLEIIAVDSGIISGGKGVNFPGVDLNLPALTEKDKLDIELAISHGADWIAMSFVRSPSDYNAIKDILISRDSDIPIIAKIEKPEAIMNLDGIIESFDGILVARGDLGVEMPIKELPILQKKIVNKCLQKRKPVIIATQMLETMIHSSNPTRAEVNDIANAIYDGSDAMMLSGETAIADHCVEAVSLMSKIASSIDKDGDMQNFNRYVKVSRKDIHDVRGAICHSAMILSSDLNIKNIVIMTETGATAMNMARYRPKAIIFALCTKKEVCSQLSLIWGIVPILVSPYSNTESMIQSTGDLLKSRKFLKKGDMFIITAGVSAGVSGSTNMLKIHEV